MANKSKRTGTDWEVAVRDFLNANGFPDAVRRAQEGNKDKGDIAGICSFVIEAKAEKKIDLAGGINEALVEAENAQVPNHLLVVKRRMVSVARGYAVQEFGQWVRHARTHLDLLREVELHRRSA